MFLFFFLFNFLCVSQICSHLYSEFRSHFLMLTAWRNLHHEKNQKLHKHLMRILFSVKTMKFLLKKNAWAHVDRELIQPKDRMTRARDKKKLKTALHSTSTADWIMRIVSIQTFLPHNFIFSLRFYFFGFAATSLLLCCGSVFSSYCLSCVCTLLWFFFCSMGGIRLYSYV